VAVGSLGKAFFDVSLNLDGYRSELNQAKQLAAGAGKRIRSEFDLGKREKALAGLDKIIGSLKEEQRELGKVIKKWEHYTSFEAGGSSKWLDKRKAKYNALEKEIQSLIEANKKLEKARKPRRGSLAALDAREQSLRREIRQVDIGTKRYKLLAAAIKKTTAARMKAEKSMNVGGFGGGLQGMAGSLTAGIGAAVALQTTVDLYKNAVKAAVELNTIASKLEASLGKRGAGAAMAFSRRLSDRLGISFKTTADAFGGFTAAATAANIPMREQKALFAAVSQAGSQMGLTSEDIAGTFQALQQMAAKGVVSMEELRQQMGERLPIALAAAAKGLEKPPAEVIKLVESGKLAAREFFPAFTKGLEDLNKAGEGVNPMASEFTRLGNAWDQLQTDFGNSQMPVVIEAVKGLTWYLKQLNNQLEGGDLGFDSMGLTDFLTPGGMVKQATSPILQGLGFGNRGEALEAVSEVSEELEIGRKAAKDLFKQAAKEAGIININLARSGDILKIKQKMVALGPAFLKQLEDQRSQDLKAAEAALTEEDRKKNALALAKEQLSISRASAIIQLQASEARLAAYAKETQMVGAIEQARSGSAIGRSGVVKSLLSFEMQQAQKLARTEGERKKIALEYGKKIFNQTVAEYKLKAQALVSEQAGQRTSLQFEQQKTAAVAKRAELEAKAALDAANTLDNKTTTEGRNAIAAAQSRLDIAREQRTEMEEMFGLQNQLLDAQQLATRESLSGSRVLALSQQAEFATARQRNQVEKDRRAFMGDTAKHASTAEISAANYAASLQSIPQALGDIPAAFNTQVHTTIDGNQTFSQMNSTLDTIASNTGRENPITVNVSVDPVSGAANSSVSGTG